eukprot:12635680-Alexandrium_andersonii.AAC.1
MEAAGSPCSWTCAWSCEVDPKKQQWLRSVMQSGDECIFPDICTLTKSPCCVVHNKACDLGHAHFCIAGFSCKDLS